MMSGISVPLCDMFTMYVQCVHAFASSKSHFESISFADTMLFNCIIWFPYKIIYIYILVWASWCLYTSLQIIIWYNGDKTVISHLYNESLFYFECFTKYVINNIKQVPKLILEFAWKLWKRKCIHHPLHVRPQAFNSIKCRLKNEITLKLVNATLRLASPYLLKEKT